MTAWDCVWVCVCLYLFRDKVRTLHQEAGMGFIEIFVDCPLGEAEARWVGIGWVGRLCVTSYVYGWMDGF